VLTGIRVNSSEEGRQAGSWHLRSEMKEGAASGRCDLGMGEGRWGLGGGGGLRGRV
jgi:hypothetical protein